MDSEHVYHLPTLKETEWGVFKREAIVNLENGYGSYSWFDSLYKTVKVV